MKAIVSFLAVLLLALPAWGQIVCPDKVEAFEPLIANLTLGGAIPEDAKVLCNWSVDEGEFWAPPSDFTSIAIWAREGKHKIRANGFWLKTKKITIDDEEVEVLLGFGQFQHEKEVRVGKDNPPPPPPPTGKWRLMMFHRSELLDQKPPEQKRLLVSLKVRQDLAALGHEFVGVLDDNSIGGESPPAWKPWIDAVKGDPLPRIALVDKEKGGKVYDYPLPADYDALVKLLENPQ